MEIFGVINASPDSLHTESIVASPDDARARAAKLLSDGATMFDLGGQGSTDAATEVDPELEWSRLEGPLRALLELGHTVSVDTWRTDVARRALVAGSTVMNAADGLQADGMIELAAEFGCPVVLPYLPGPDPLRLGHVDGDPVDVMIEWFESALARVDPFGIRANMILDPGTGFAPRGWAWEERYHYQKHVYTNLDRLRVFGLPLYVAVPWKVTPDRMELLDIVVSHDIDYARAHDPARVLAAVRGPEPG